MRVEFKSVADAGVSGKERLVFKVQVDTDIGAYAVLRTGFTDTGPTTAVEDVFWFPDKAVKAGDLVVLYTKAGSQGEKTIETGTAHFFYWDRSSPLWNDPEYGAVLLEVDEWVPIRTAVKRRVLLKRRKPGSPPRA